MRRPAFLFFFCVLAAGTLLAQTDAPPELHHPNAPEELPPVETTRPHDRGTLTIDFVGNTAFTAAQLRAGIVRQIQTIEEYGLDEPNAYDAAFFTDSFYRKRGYSEAEATATITGPWHLRIDIAEGPLAHVGTITFTGNQGYDTETLSKYLLGPTREHYPRIREVINLPFVQADIDAGVDLIRRLYATEGYLHADIPSPIITLNATQTVADIALHIVEGTQYHFGKIRFIGPLIFPEDDLRAQIAEETQNIFTEGRLAAAQRKLEDYFKNRGYFEASVEVEGDPAQALGGKVPITVLLKPGSLFHFDGITVAGNSGVQTSFIQKRLSKMTGQVYDPLLIDRHFRTLIGTGLFRSVRITPQAIPGNQVRLDVSVEEAKPKEFGFGLGYATFEGGIINLSYSDRNLFGSGRPITFNFELNQRGYSGDIVYTNPWLFDSDYSLRMRLYALTRELKGYSKNELGFLPTLGRKITDHWELSAFLLAKYVTLRNVLIEPESLVGRQKYTVASLGFSSVVDYRNNVALPTRGFIFGLSVDSAPVNVSDVTFLRGMARFTYYIPITAKSSLALGARAGIMASLNGQELPIDERFFSGGATTVRSFSELTLGPRDHAGYPLGGEAFTTFNAEYSFPLIGDLYGAIFVDAGNVISHAENFGLEDMRYAIGAGLRYNLPIGSLRLDYGYNPDRQPGEAQGALHFAIGVAF